MTKMPERMPSSRSPDLVSIGQGAWFSRPVPAGLPPALARAEGRLAALPFAAVAPRPLRIPVEALVDVGRPALPPPAARRALRPPEPPEARPAVANDNAGRAAAPARSPWRSAFFLVLLFATVIAAYYSGRHSVLHRVVDVDYPWDPRSEVT